MYFRHRFLKRIVFKILLSDRKHIWMLIFLGSILGTLIGVTASLFQLLLDSIVSFKDYLIYLSTNIIIQICISVVFSVLLLCLGLFLVKKFSSEAGGSGINEVEGALKGCRVIRWRRVLPVKFFSGIFSLGASMTLGKEGPTVHIGASLGQMIVDKFNLKSRQANSLVAAGAGAGIAAAFNAPMAGIIFVIEEMNKKFRFSTVSIKLVILTSIVSIFFARVIMGNPHTIKMEILPSPETMTLWIFVVLGALFGALGYIFNKGIIRMADYFSYASKKKYWKLVILVGSLIGVMYVILPNATGDGDGVINDVLANNIGIRALIFIFVVRFFAVLLCYGTGTTGGIFAPMLAIGTLFGLCFGNIVSVFLPELGISPEVFAVAGMSALFTATVGAPLTGIIIVLEMTMNYQLVLPLMITCFSASIVGYLLHEKPIYETLLRRSIYLERMQKFRQQTQEKQEGQAKEDNSQE